MKFVDFVKWSVIIACTLMIATPFSVLGYHKYKHYVTEKKTHEYLIESGYEAGDILSIESKFKKGTKYTAEVTFKDEPNVSYDYVIRNKKVEQFGTTLSEGDNFKHLEK